MSERVDVALFRRGLAPSRERARALVMAGVVYVDGRRADKAGMPVPEGAAVEVREDPVPFVSRGGLKLQKALGMFGIDLTGAYALDVGASTGGFTDCMLQNGAAHVCAIDVGYGQLDWKLRGDARVTVMERTNARYMEPGWFAQPAAFASIDVSFISLRLILPPLLPCLAPGGMVVALVKPQFEAGRGEVGKHGVVRDPAVHAAVCRQVIDFADGLGYAVRGLSFSPITGPKGNIEFLLHLQRAQDRPPVPDAAAVEAVVAAAHAGVRAHAGEG